MKITDTDRLDWLEGKGNGVALIHDDNSHWTVEGTGMQNIIEDGGPFNLSTSYFCKKKNFRPTIRQAIDLAIKRSKKELE